MKSERHITYLRIGCRLEAVIDGLMIIPLLLPAVCRVMFNMSSFNPSNDFGYANIA